MNTMTSYSLTVMKQNAEAIGLTFFHGTIRMVSNELINIGNITTKVPMCYAVEPMKFRKNLVVDSTIAGWAEFRLFVLDSCKYGEWLTADHYTNVIVPMENKLDDLLERLRNDARVVGEEFTEADIWNHVIAGSYLDEKGKTKSMFKFYFSGPECRLSLPILKQLKCE